MNRISQNPDGSYKWDCAIDRDFHQRSSRKSLWAVLILCVFVLIVFLISSRESGPGNTLRPALIVIGVILVITLPLLYLWHTASDPHEQYVMTEEYVKSGYGKAVVFSNFKTTEEAIITAKYIELKGQRQIDRVYIPEEDMEFVLDFILQRLPEGTKVIRK